MTAMALAADNEYAFIVALVLPGHVHKGRSRQNLGENTNPKPHVAHILSHVGAQTCPHGLRQSNYRRTFITVEFPIPVGSGKVIKIDVGIEVILPFRGKVPVPSKALGMLMLQKKQLSIVLKMLVML